MPRFVFSKCPNCRKENQHNWVDLTASKPGAKVFRSVNPPSEQELHNFVVTCNHCHTRYKVTPPEGGTNDAETQS
jgi:5-methylcytosine-specific restriction endonuclease McrA